MFYVFIPGHIPGYQLLAITLLLISPLPHHSLVEFQEILLLFYFFKNPCSFKLQSSDSCLSKGFVLLSLIAFVSELSQHFYDIELILSCSLSDFTMLNN